MKPIGRCGGIELGQFLIAPQIMLGAFLLRSLHAAARVGGHQPLVHRILAGALEVSEHQLDGARPEPGACLPAALPAAREHPVHERVDVPPGDGLELAITEAGPSVLERVADLKGFRRVVFAWIPWSGITPDGAPLLLRDISSQEVYALDLDTP